VPKKWPKGTPPEPPAPLRADNGELEEEGEPLAEEFERFFLCPLCGARVSVLLDPSVEEQTMIEDCEVCCQPLEIKYTIEEGKVAEFDVQAA
jgi:transcription elongation factor Elf1